MVSDRALMHHAAHHHGAAHHSATHHAAALHHGGVQGVHALLHEIRDFGRMFLQSCDGLWIVGGLQHRDAFIGRLVTGLDPVLVAEDPTTGIAFNRQAGIIACADAVAHLGYVFLDQVGQLRVIGFGDRTDAVRQIFHRALDTVVIDEHRMNDLELSLGALVMRHSHHSHHARAHSMHAERAQMPFLPMGRDKVSAGAARDAEHSETSQFACDFHRSVLSLRSRPFTKLLAFCRPSYDYDHTASGRGAAYERTNRPDVTAPEAVTRTSSSRRKPKFVRKLVAASQSPPMP